MGEGRRRRMYEAANPLTPATPIGPYLDRATLLKAGFVEAPSSCFTMTPITIAELWDREKANLRRGFRGRQADLSPYLDLAQCEADARRVAALIQKAARAEKRAAFDKARGKRPSGRRLNNRLTGGMIVGVDCEGMNIGGDFILADRDERATRLRKHHVSDDRDDRDDPQVNPEKVRVRGETGG